MICTDMVLNLVALACVAGAIIASIILFRRHARRLNVGAAGGADNVCLRCGTPAASLTSFVCPGCGHDVREAGVGPRRRRSPIALFWGVVSYTCAFLAIAAILSNVLSDSLPRVYSVARNTSITVSSPEIRGVELSFEGSGRDEASVGGTVSGELYGRAAPVILEVDRPSLRWRLLDLWGKQLDAGARADGKVVYRWMELAGAPTESAVAHSDAAHIADALAQLVGTKLEMPPVPGTGRALGLSYSAASGGGSSNVPDPRWPPLLVIGASALWLLGVYLILMPRGAGGRGAPAAPAVAEGVAP
jgi:hypothetical protein